MAKTQRLNVFRPKLISIAVASCFVAGTANSAQPVLPTGAVPVIGITSINQVNNTLNIVTNAQRSIANFTTFSVGADAAVRISQPSATSGFLSRVTGGVPSEILGSVWSNGRFYLINTSGILFGAGSQIDVAGLVASSGNLSNADFLGNRLNFTGMQGAGSVVNEGNINTKSGGNVYLVGPAVTNSGIITSPKGEVILAAGNSVSLVDAGTPNLQVEITAPDNQAVNLGQIIVDSGRAGIYAGLIKQAGIIRANSVVAGEGGQIKLVATKNTTLEAGSIATANGASGGSITVQSGDTTLVVGTVEAKGSEGQGGTIQLLGNLVGLTGNASINASGDTGGGTVLVGGDFQGSNPDVQNAFRTNVGTSATIAADAITSGDGGKVIVWSDDATRFYGTISMKGGAQSGNGGFAEVSSKGYLDYQGLTIASAPNGKSGTLLLDPSDVIINDVGNPSGGGDDGSFDGDEFYLSGANPSYIKWSTIAQQMDPAQGDSNAIITTSSGAFASGGMSIATASPDLATPNSLTLLAHSSLYVNAAITNTGSGNISLYSGWNGASTITPVVTPGFGYLSLNASVSTLGDVALVSGYGIYQSSLAPITANRLLAVADGGEGVSLNAATNMVNFLAGKTAGSSCCSAGSFRFMNGKELTVDSVTIPSGTVNGVQIANGNNDTIDINVTSGVLTVNNPVSMIGVGNSSLYLAGTDGVVVNNIVKAQSLDNPLTGTFSFDVNASSGNAYIDVYSSAGGIDVTGAGGISAITGKGGNVTTTFPGSASASAGYAQAYLSAATGITVDGSITATGGQGGSATTTSGAGYTADAYGGSASVNLYVFGGDGVVNGGVNGSGNITATAGAGGTASGGSAANATGGFSNVYVTGYGPTTLNVTISSSGGDGGTATAASSTPGYYVYADAYGGSGSVDIFSDAEVVVNGAISATGGSGGSATATVTGVTGVYAYAYSRGWSGDVSVSSGTSVEVNGAVNANGGSGGSASATNTLEPANIFHTADGGGGFIQLLTPGLVTIGAGGMTATGGNGGTGGARYGGSAAIAIADGAEGFSGYAGAIQIGGNLIVTGGAGTNGGQGGDANVIAWGTDVNVGANITASAGNGTPVGVADVELTSLGNVTLGGNITTTGENPLGGDNGIAIWADNAIISEGGVLSAVKAGSNFPVITLQAVNGIGTLAAPVRLQDGAEATSPELFIYNSGAAGDIAVSFANGNVEIVNDLGGLLNNNPTGTYFINVEAGSFLLATSFAPNFLPLAAGQNVSISVAAPGEDITFGPGASLITSGGGTITAAAGGNINVLADAAPAFVMSSGLMKINAATGTLTLQGGSSGTGNSAQLVSDGGQNITATAINLIGGSGGAANSARIANNAGTQTISATNISLTGGAGGLADQGNFAQIYSAGSQDITAASMIIAAGTSGGFNNFANIVSPIQTITISGDLTLTGGNSTASTNSGGGARIGGLGGASPSATNLTLDVSGNVIMTGGDVANAGSAIGSNFNGGQTTDITMNVGGSVTLNPGTFSGASSRIGSPGSNIAGGIISVLAGGNIALNSAAGNGTFIRTLGEVALGDGALLAASITEGADSVIQANFLTADSSSNISLGGANQVAIFGGSSSGGNVSFNNTLPLTVFGISAGGSVTVTNSGSIALGGGISSGSIVTLSSGGAITNGTGGTSVIAPSLVLNAATGIGSVAAKIGMQVSGMALNSSSGEIGVSNSGDLTLGDVTLSSGTNAEIITTGTMVTTGNLSAPVGNMTLNAGNGMVVLNDVTAGGNLTLSSGIGDMGFDGVSVSGNNVTLSGNNILVGFTTSALPTTVSASNLLTATSEGNLDVLGGANSGANALLEGYNVNLTVGTVSGFLNINGGGNGATAQISSVSPTTITVNFPTLDSGGYFVDGDLNGAITVGNSGFFAGGQPAVLTQNLIVTYGLTPPPPVLPPPTEPPSEIVEVINQVVASTNEQTDDQPIVTTTDPKEGEGEKDKKGLATCK